METLAPSGLLRPLALTALLFQTIRTRAKLDSSVDVRCNVYVHVFITQNKCTSIGNPFTAVACTQTDVKFIAGHYLRRNGLKTKKRLKIVNIVKCRAPPAGEEKHSHTVMTCLQLSPCTFITLLYCVLLPWH